MTFFLLFIFILLYGKQLGSHVLWNMLHYGYSPSHWTNKSCLCVSHDGKEQISGLQMQMFPSLIYHHIIRSVLLCICWGFFSKTELQCVKWNWINLIRLISPRLLWGFTFVHWSKNWKLWMCLMSQRLTNSKVQGYLLFCFSKIKTADNLLQLHSSLQRT